MKLVHGAGLVPLMLMFPIGSASASGFALIEQSASGLGNAFAGASASAEDASTIYFNPAGLTYIPEGKNLSIALHAIDPSATFSRGATQSAVGMKAGGTANPYGDSGNGGDLGRFAYVPNLYFSMPVARDVVVGLGVNAPFGLKTEYDDGWAGRFQGIKSEVKTVNINPTIAYRLSDSASFGFGLNYQKIDATLTKAINYSAIVAAAGGAALAGLAGMADGRIEGRNELKGSDSAWGYNLGALFQLSERTRMGISYRSSVTYRLKGTHTATHPVTGVAAVDNVIASNASTIDQNVSLNLEVPDMLAVAFNHKLNDRWDLMGDVTRTGWSSIQEIRVKYANGAADDVTNWKLRDTLRIGVGANYRYRDDLILRMGAAYDQSPVSDQYRTVRLPDNNRSWLSVGARYLVSKDAAVDIGFAYLWAKSASINNSGDVAATTLGYPRGLINGGYDASVRILSAQYSHRF